MARRNVVRGGTGIAAGALPTAPLFGIFALGSFARVPLVPFTVFEWLIRVLPGRVVIFGLDLTVRVLEGLGFNIKNTAKTAEMKITSVIDTVATDSPVMRGGRTFVPIGGIAHTGAKGISKVEVQSDAGSWQAAQLRDPLS